MTEEKGRSIETKDEALFEFEIGDLRHLVIAPEQDPYSDHPMKYLGHSVIERMMRLYRHSRFW